MENSFAQQWVLSTLAPESILTQESQDFKGIYIHTIWDEHKRRFVKVVEINNEYSVTSCNTKTIKYNNITMEEALVKCAEELCLTFVMPLH